MRFSSLYPAPRSLPRAADARSQRRVSALPLVALLIAGLAPVTTEARVKILTRPDGTRYIYDESQSQYNQRTASSLLAPKAYISSLIDHWARDRGLSPKLVQSVVQVESGYNPRARSSKGAMGLMQLMPGTARMLRVTDPYDADQNIRGGTLYLRHQLDHFSGDVTLALAAYNAGPGAVTQYGGVPPYRETRNYVQKVLGLYRGHAPAALQDYARDEAKKRTEVARKETVRQQRGGKVYMSRGKNNRVVFTSAPPKPD